MTVITIAIDDIVTSLERNGYRFAPRKGSRKFFDYKVPGPIIGRDFEYLQILMRHEECVHDYLVERAKEHLAECRRLLDGGK